MVGDRCTDCGQMLMQLGMHPYELIRAFFFRCLFGK